MSRDDDTREAASVSSQDIALERISKKDMAMSDTEASHDVAELAIDVFDTDTAVILVAPLGGVDPSDITIQITDEILSVAGVRKLPSGLENKNIHTQECFWGPFTRTIILPSDIDKKGMKARFSQGVLEIHVPKLEHTGNVPLEVV